ncbi:phage tail protein [Sorangium sp. So ce375]|uniref:phage tail protein n=1 Tax=Sorangium sp. So ce375 TaxID=3133306 RepID=UPI003F5C560C
MFGLPFGVNALFALSGARLDPYLGYNFLVEVDGLLVGGFRDVRGLEASVEVKEYAEGGVNGYIHKLPGETRFPNLVLSRGLTDLDTLWVWFNDVSEGVITRRNLSILLLDQERLPAMWWDVRDALPVKWTGPQLQGAAGTEVAAESIELVHRGITKPTASRVLSAVRAAGSLISG